MEAQFIFNLISTVVSQQESPGFVAGLACWVSMLSPGKSIGIGPFCKTLDLCSVRTLFFIIFYNTGTSVGVRPLQGLFKMWERSWLRFKKLQICDGTQTLVGHAATTPWPPQRITSFNDVSAGRKSGGAESSGIDLPPRILGWGFRQGFLVAPPLFHSPNTSWSVELKGSTLPRLSVCGLWCGRYHYNQFPI